MKKFRILIILMIGLWHVPRAQESFPVNGVQDKRLDIYAFTNATIYVDYQTRLESATLVIKDGRVEAAGTNVAIPEGAIVKDLAGKTIYPAFVDAYSDYGMPEVKAARFNFNAPPQTESKKEGAYGWNEAIKAEIDAAEVFKTDQKSAEALRKAGFGAVVTHHPDGIVRGTSALVSLNDGPEQSVLIRKNVGANYSFSRGSSNQQNPNSIMGAAALLRQTYYDAMWYASRGNKEQTNLSLEAFNALRYLPAVFTTDSKHNTLLADKIGDEFGVQYIIKGAGDEYQNVPLISKTNGRMIIPVNYPDAYDVEDPFDALNVSLKDMKHWELAPKNAAMLNEAGVPIAFTTEGLKNPSDFLKNVRKAVTYGLPEEVALKAITYNPAVFLQVEEEVGSLQKGRLANFIITSGNLFDESTKIYENWTQGQQMSMIPLTAVDFSGIYNLTVGEANYQLKIEGDPGQHTVSWQENDSTSTKLTAKIDGQNISFTMSPDGGQVRLSGFQDGSGFTGRGRLADGSWVDWSAQKTGESAGEEKKEGDKAEVPETGNIIFPFVAYGNETIPTAEKVLIKNATVWTNEDEGILENTDVLLENGKIAAIGQNLSAGGAKEVDGTGKHLTAGIIDEHSHTALRGVNEASQASTSEVRMYDAVDPDDIDIYRQLAGGVTAAQLLHGSANPIGGQSALVKFRWGRSAEEMAIDGADGFIKFALGENVKQSNRSNAYTTRFPQTRMGVEQVFVDAFTRAKAYDESWKAYNALPAKTKANTPAPRKDIELEALAEILNEERFISCHSYVQSEINMLMKVAESFGFRVNTFTHILEGYKVADKMAEHGAGGSTFADWWAYKFEVREAIPYNAALMSSVGVTTAINSDDSEMARRLNQEAAKTIKYGGVDEETAMKMVTLNPARLLHLDDRMGSIKVGKDADVVLWSTHPLSIYTKAEKTFVDGILYFDIERDEALRKSIEAERARLVAKMIEAKGNGAATKKPSRHQRHQWECEDEVDYMYLIDIDEN